MRQEEREHGMKRTGQHATPRASRDIPIPRMTIMSISERPEPRSTVATRLGGAIKATPVATSNAADSITSLLVVMLVLQARLHK
jgi:hypothetical protein